MFTRTVSHPTVMYHFFIYLVILIHYEYIGISYQKVYHIQVIHEQLRQIDNVISHQYEK